MKLLVLIIYSENLPVYKEHLKAWRLYSKVDPNVDVYFMKLSTEHTTVSIEDDIVIIPGEESYRNMVYKFVSTLEHIPYKKYDYILRTNMSSFWVFKNLFLILESLPKEKLLAGEVNGNYVSGAGMIFTPDVCDLLVQNKEAVINFDLSDPFDDVILSFYLHKNHGIQYTQTYPRRYDIYLPENGSEEKITDTLFHFRVKQDDEHRMTEYSIMFNLWQRFY